VSAVAIVDYGMGNLDSVARAVEECGGRALIVDRPEPLREAAAVILPGVGAFGRGMKNLSSRGFVRALREDVVDREVPLLGLCLGMQLLATRSDEHGDNAGLGFVEGDVVRLEPAPGLPVPHVGWNNVDQRRPSGLLAGVPSGTDFYFVHSYHFVPEHDEDVVATTDYGLPVVAVVERGPIWGVQFHPEKSQRPGLALLRAFLEIARVGAARPHAAVRA
jgi:glutamine amidotransferase